MVKWKTIEGYEYYQVSDTGLVRSLARKVLSRPGVYVPIKGKILIPTTDSKGYLRVSLNKNGHKTTRKVHRLVAQAFIPNPKHLPQVNHKNGIKADNRVDNLEWVTNAENQRHSYKVLGRQSPSKGRFGAKHWNVKVIQQYKNNVLIQEFFGTRDAARKTGINRWSILQSLTGRIPGVCGFQWKYKEVSNV